MIELLCIPDGAISYAEYGPDDFDEPQAHDANERGLGVGGKIF